MNRFSEHVRYHFNTTGNSLQEGAFYYNIEKKIPVNERNSWFCIVYNVINGTIGFSESIWYNFVRKLTNTVRKGSEDVCGRE